MTPPTPDGKTPRDSGMSLVEILVAMGLFGLLSTILLSFALGTGRLTKDTSTLSGINEESRLAMERITRELRQADAVLDLRVPTNVGDPTSLTFWADFNGNGAKDLSVTDPEVLTYRWDPVTDRLTLTADDEDGTAVTRPVLATQVSNFTLALSSSRWQYDSLIPLDGVSSWQELDAAGSPVGDRDGSPDPFELELVDLVKVSMTVLDGSHAQTYTTEVDLRNRNQN